MNENISFSRAWGVQSVRFFGSVIFQAPLELDGRAPCDARASAVQLHFLSPAAIASRLPGSRKPSSRSPLRNAPFSLPCRSSRNQLWPDVMAHAAEDIWPAQPSITLP